MSVTFHLSLVTKLSLVTCNGDMSQVTVSSHVTSDKLQFMQGSG